MRLDDVSGSFVLLFVLLPFLLMVLMLVAFATWARRAVVPDDQPGEGRARPGWGNPLLWLAVATAFAVLGFFAFPHLFGGVFLFLPFVWIGGRRKR